MLGKCNLLFFISAVLLTLGSVASANKCTSSFRIRLVLILLTLTSVETNGLTNIFTMKMGD